MRTVGAKLLLVDRQKDGWRDLTKLTVAFRHFDNVPKNSCDKKIVLSQRFLLPCSVIAVLYIVRESVSISCDA